MLGGGSASSIPRTQPVCAPARKVLALVYGSLLEFCGTVANGAAVDDGPRPMASFLPTHITHVRSGVIRCRQARRRRVGRVTRCRTLLRRGVRVEGWCERGKRWLRWQHKGLSDYTQSGFTNTAVALRRSRPRSRAAPRRAAFSDRDVQTRLPASHDPEEIPNIPVVPHKSALQ